MRLYHGSNTAIEHVILERSRPYKDFGKGFYLTDIYSQAEQWSRRIADRFGGEPCISEFEFEIDNALSLESGLSVKIFDEPDKEWALFVMGNRNEKLPHPIHSYDIVIGPVADDRMATLFASYALDIIDLDDVVRGLKYKGLNSQYFFHTEESLKYLHLI